MTGLSAINQDRPIPHLFEIVIAIIAMTGKSDTLLDRYRTPGLRVQDLAHFAEE